MGLDMYLYAEKYVSCYNHSTAEEKKAYEEVAKAIGIPEFKCEGSPHLTVSLSVAYWRKANAIHNWFVKNVQGGVDECQRSHVSREQLEELCAECKKVLDSVETVEGDINMGTTWHSDGKVEQHVVKGKVVAQKEIAAATLPTTSGFFFGSTQYDQYYLDDLRETIDQIRAALDNPGFARCEFYYRASW